jgi:hypothetical protein
MTKLICDTNVWYELAAGRIDKSKINGQLFGTHITCTELASSQRLISDLPLVKEVVKALKQNHNKIILPNPVEHILSIFFDDFEPDTSGAINILNSFDTLLVMDDVSFPDEKINLVQEKIDRITNPMLDFVARVNDGLILVREKVLIQEGKKKHLQSDHLKFWKGYIANFVKTYGLDYYKKEYIIDPNDENWIKVNFFIGVWEKYFKLLESENRKFDRNDWADLFNLVYVQPGYKYWTFEKKWKNIFKNDSGLKSYLYEYNGS